MEATRRGETPLDVLNRLDGTAPLSSSDAGLYAAEQLADQVAWNPERFDLEAIAQAWADATRRGIHDPVFSLDEFGGVSALDARQVAEALGADPDSSSASPNEELPFDEAWTRTCLKVADALEQNPGYTGTRNRAIQLLAADYLNAYAYDESIMGEFDSQLKGDTDLLANVLYNAALAHVQADLDLTEGDFEERATCDLDLIVGEVMDWSTPEGVGTPRDLLAWFKEADGILMSQATGMPACFGPNYRVGPGRYVSEQTWEAVLPTKSERCLYLILANEGTDEDILANTFDNMGSADWLVFESDLALNADPEAFFVPIGRDDFTQEELEELAASRPDLFSGAELTDLSKTGGHRGNDSLARQATEARGASDPCEDQGRKEGISRDGR